MTATTLTEFLLARIAEDERLIAERSVENIPFDCWGPDRIEAECEAKRLIVEQCSLSLSRMPPLPLPVGSGRSGEYAVASIALLSLAAVYADHPDFDEAWRPRAAERLTSRAETAEAKVARVEALRDRWLEDAENDNIRLEDVARDLTGALAGKHRATPKTPCPECRCLYGTHQKACPGYAQPARADEFEADQ